MESSEEEFEYVLTFGKDRSVANDFQDIQAIIVEIIIDLRDEFLKGTDFNLFTDETCYTFNIQSSVFNISSSISPVKDNFKINDDLTCIIFNDFTININYDNIFVDATKKWFWK